MTETTKRANPSWQEVRDALLADDPEVREAYLELAPASLVAREIARAREAAGISQAELGRRMGTTQSVISRLERMETTPNLRTVAEVAHALGFELDVRFVGAGAVGSAATAGAYVPDAPALDKAARELEGFVEWMREAVQEVVERISPSRAAMRTATGAKAANRRHPSDEVAAG